MLQHGSMGQSQNKEFYFMFTYRFLAFFSHFSSKSVGFYHFHSFFAEVLLEIGNCQWNSMLVK